MAYRILIPRPFEYHSPKTLDEALKVVALHGDGGKILAGGQSLIPLMKLRLSSPEHLIDLGRVPGLDRISLEGETLIIGSMARTADIERSAVVRAKVPVFSECASHVADPPVRNMGTLGGNLCHGDPTNDFPAVVVAMEATLRVESVRGPRSIPAAEFFVDTFATALLPGEVLTQVRVPVVRGRRATYLKLERQAGDFGIVGVAARVDRQRGKCAGAGIALTGVGPKVTYAKRASAELVGRVLEGAVVERAAAAASEECEPSSDLRGSAEYKREMVRVMTRRAILQALGRSEA